MPPETPPPELSPKETLQVALSTHMQAIHQTLNAVKEINGTQSQEIILLHNACHELMQLCGLIIGVTIFPELTKKEPAGESNIITKP